MVPSFGYASLLPEMASSILAQQCDVGFRAVLVDDGDPDPTLVELCEYYAAAEPDVFHYLRPRRNGGLSATRNRGIEYLLEYYPSIEMVMFPDADDRMLAAFIQKSYERFVTARSEADSQGQKLGWVFEHPNIFGEPGRMTRLTRHSTLWNMVGATQMPSSALSAEMYREGLRYDETLVWGGEDWEFSIRALNAGFTGVYSSDQGFHWRRRPGSMSSSQQQNKARGHNRTFIKLSNKPMFQRDYVWARLQQENPSFCVLSPGGFSTANSVSGLADLVNGAPNPASFAQLGAQLNNSLVHPTDPCPQSYYVVDRDGSGAPLAPAEHLSSILLWSEYLMARGFSVSHVVADAASVPRSPVLARGVRRDAMPFLMAIPHQHFLTLLAGRTPPPDQRVTLTWPAPVFEKKGLLGALRDKFPRRANRPKGTRQQLDGILASLNAVGYAYKRSPRFGSQVWKPQGLTWREMPGHLTEVPQQRLHDTGRLDRKIILCSNQDVPTLREDLEECQGPSIDVMIDLGKSEGPVRPAFAALQRRRIVGDVFLLENRRVDDISLREYGLNILGLYGEVLHWRGLAHVNDLGRLGKLGVSNRLVLKVGDIETSFQNFNSAFKCFDSYNIAPPLDDEENAIAALQARGVPRKSITFGNPFEETNAI
ncbi:glycosyltransferase family A protein [Roseovarius salinarum]|uniref:glycosyltransferase family A protein n=1 Tax=Roseovarius salinarum TaxID=1981892 RepID=UPI0012FFD703|nr:glycosyltransferase family A protein [Roseovarius salinarum]